MKATGPQGAVSSFVRRNRLSLRSAIALLSLAGVAAGCDKAGARGSDAAAVSSAKGKESDGRYERTAATAAAWASAAPKGAAAASAHGGTYASADEEQAG